MGDGKRRCARCQYEFIPHKLPLTFSRNEGKEILHLFLMIGLTKNRQGLHDKIAGCLVLLQE